MDFEKMWNGLKTDLMKKVDNKAAEPAAHEAYMNMLVSMTRIETQELAESRRQETTEYIVRQDITGNVDIKARILEKSAKEMFEWITGNKVIDSLEKLESEIQKRKGKSMVPNQEPLIVDEKVEIPDSINHEATIHGIKIARFGIDVIHSDEIPKGVFLRKETFHLPGGIAAV